MKGKSRKGFTLVELIVTVAIISFVLGIAGYFIIQIINNSEEESYDLSMTNIKNTAKIYVEEFPDDITWQQTIENEGEKFSCISINELINKNLLKKEVKTNYDLPNYVIVTMDESNTIISEELDNEGICNNSDTAVKSPTEKEFCNNFTYTGTEQTLTNGLLAANKGFSFQNNTGTNAGTYKVEAVLEDGYHWSDGTSDNKIIRCSIKKAIPNLELDPTGIDNTGGLPIGTKKTIKVITVVPGTITVKSSNEEYIKATVDNDKKEITIEFLASREIESYVTVTLSPDDINNYYSNSKAIIIGKPVNKEIAVPTADVYCMDNLTYNASLQTLTKTPGEGMIFDNYQATNIGTYTITANLKYGYSWKGMTEEEKYTAKTFQCSIYSSPFTVTYDNQGGSGCDTKKVIYGKAYGDLCTPTRSGYTFSGWYTDANSGIEVTSDTLVTISNDHTIYARWKENNYLVDNSIYATTFQEAVNLASANSTIKLLRSYHDTVPAIVDKNIVFEVGSYNWQRTAMTTIRSGVSLNITGAGTISKNINTTATSDSDSLFYNSGTLNLNYSGTINYIIATDTSTSNVIYNIIDNYGVTSVVGTKFNTKNARNISNQNGANLTISNAEIVTNIGRGINNDGGTVTVNKTTFNTTNARAIQNNGKGTVTIKENSKIESIDARAVQNEGNGTINIENSTLSTKKIATESRVIFNNSNGVINMTGSVINSNNETGIYNNGAGAVNINNSTSNATNGYAIHNESSGTLYLESSTVNGTSARGVHNQGTGTVTIKNTDILTTTGRGIHNNNKGKIDLYNSTIDSTKATAIYNTSYGIVNIYSGTIKSYDGRTIDNSASGEVNIYGGTLEAIKVETASRTIFNDGENSKITITDGTITSTEANAIHNNSIGTIIVNGGEINSSSGRAIENAGNGTILVNGGSITANEASSIYNKSSGIVTVTAGIITSIKTNAPIGIYNYSNGTINVSGGTIKATGSNAKSIYLKDKTNGKVNITGGILSPAYSG